ncbi:MAG: hypothetical protein ACLFUS_00995 [Candidatus Sumerlaeia bacterium]
MIYEDRNLNVSELFLDENNPRFPKVSNQRDAIEAMLEDQGDKIANLAMDIYSNGLNPSSRLIVFKEKNRFTDGDGNRRLTALKILETPSLADSYPRIKKKIQQILGTKGSVPTEVSCVVFMQRKQARRWIENNHDGEQEGRGVVRWNAEQKDRFRGKPSIGLAALDELSASNEITDDDRSIINKSTLDRLLEFKDSKATLSISRKGEKFIFGDKGKLKRAVLGLRDQKVDRVYTAAKGRDYLSEVLSDGVKDAANNERKNNSLKGNTRSRRTRGNRLEPFGGRLSLKTGPVNNLYRDIEEIFDYFAQKRGSLTESFIVLFRMALRVLAETAAKEVDKNLQVYLQDGFDSAKKLLDRNIKTTLANQEVRKDTIVRLFQTGAHDYHNSKNEEQALALSIILGKILSNSHGSKE